MIDHLKRQIPEWVRETAVAGIVFEAASMSKPVFAYVAMKLCETGVMNLETPLTYYTSDLFLQSDARLELITARHVLSHTSWFPELAFRGSPDEDPLHTGRASSGPGATTPLLSKASELAHAACQRLSHIAISLNDRCITHTSAVLKKSDFGTACAVGSMPAEVLLSEASRRGPARLRARSANSLFSVQKRHHVAKSCG